MGRLMWCKNHFLPSFPSSQQKSPAFPRALHLRVPRLTNYAPRRIELLVKVKVKAKASSQHTSRRDHQEGETPSLCGWFVVSEEEGNCLAQPGR